MKLETAWFVRQGRLRKKITWRQIKILLAWTWSRAKHQEDNDLTRSDTLMNLSGQRAGE